MDVYNSECIHKTKELFADKKNKNTVRMSRGIQLNCSLAPPPVSTVQDGSHTPNTPEILNTIVNITSGGAGSFPGYSTPSHSPPPLHHHHHLPPATSSSHLTQLLPPPPPPPPHPSAAPHVTSSHLLQPHPLAQMVSPLANPRPQYLPPELPVHSCPPMDHQQLPHQYPPPLPPPPPNNHQHQHQHQHLLHQHPQQHQQQHPQHQQPQQQQQQHPQNQQQHQQALLVSVPPPLLSPPGAPSLSSPGPPPMMISPVVSGPSLPHTLITSPSPVYSDTSESGGSYLHSPNSPVYSGAFCGEYSAGGGEYLGGEYTVPEEYKPELATNGGEEYGENYGGGGAGPSVEHYRSQFIKEGLKMKVQQKLKVEPLLASPCSESEVKIEQEDSLTPEDEERRRRRRERNKVAATKCRNKKKERTTRLVSESEILEHQNVTLKQEVMRLEAEKRHLVEVLSMHEPTCSKRRRRNSSSSSHHQHSPSPSADDVIEVTGGGFRVPPPPPTSGQRTHSRQQAGGSYTYQHHQKPQQEHQQQQQQHQDHRSSQNRNDSSIFNVNRRLSSQQPDLSLPDKRGGEQQGQDDPEQRRHLKPCNSAVGRRSFLGSGPQHAITTYGGFQLDNRCVAL